MQELGRHAIDRLHSRVQSAPASQRLVERATTRTGCDENGGLLLENWVLCLVVGEHRRLGLPGGLALAALAGGLYPTLQFDAGLGLGLSPGIQYWRISNIQYWRMLANAGT